jgi:hypothetical protein
MAADILSLEGFVNVDPIHPQGGPDGRKDIRCLILNVPCVAACYFPNNSGNIRFKDLEEKYLHDLEGVKLNSAKGFVFFTNVPLTDSERQILENAATTVGCVFVRLFHLEAIRAVLDRPSGYGVRLKYLDLAMTKEEQVGFFANYMKILRTELAAELAVTFKALLAEHRLTAKNDMQEVLREAASAGERTSK